LLICGSARKIVFCLKKYENDSKSIHTNSQYIQYGRKAKDCRRHLKKIREDDLPEKEATHTVSQKSSILAFTGIWSEEEASVFGSAVQESRKIDINELIIISLTYYLVAHIFVANKKSRLFSRKKTAQNIL